MLIGADPENKSLEICLITRSQGRGRRLSYRQDVDLSELCADNVSDFGSGKIVIHKLR